MSKILRGGRLGSVREDVAKFTSSIQADAPLLNAVVAINKAHVVMLIEKRIIPNADGIAILSALAKTRDLQLDGSMEDVHTAVEEFVLKEAGTLAGGNIHIAKSRNDQVATAIRIALRQEILALMRSIAHVQEHLAEVAEEHFDTVILEYTHLQPAQPVTFAHYLISYLDALERDMQRIQSAYYRVNQCPLGAGACATTSFEIDRDRTSQLLGFNGLLENSIDAVGSRDFILETLSVLSLLAVNLSRFAEDLIIWSTPDFGVVELPDEFTSTSSIMPQKKNPEILEIIRARASQVLGNFVTANATVKSLPSTYNLDFQEITPKLWDSLTIIRTSLDILHKLLPKLKITADVSEKALKGFVGATELANVLVRNYNIPFRSAHKIVGAFVKSLIDVNSTFAEATPEQLTKAALDSAGIELNVNPRELSSLADPLKLVNACRTKGGPASDEVKRAVCEREKMVLMTKSNISKMDKELEDADSKLEETIQAYLSVDKLEDGTFKNDT